MTEEGIIEQMLEKLPDQSTQALQAKKEEFEFYSKSDGKSVKSLNRTMIQSYLHVKSFF